MRERILDRSYINWLESIIDRYGSIDDSYLLFNSELNGIDIENICKLRYFFEELFKYNNKVNNNFSSTINLKYKDIVYTFTYDGRNYFCKRGNDKDNVINYKDFRRTYKMSMDEIFNGMKDTVIDSLDKSDLEKIRRNLDNIKTPILVTGVGGSSVVSEFASKVLNRKNKIITRNTEVRDMLYMDLSGYDNVMSCSYSGKNYGVDMSFNNNLDKYLFSAKDNKYPDVTNVKYEMRPEDSFISLGATIVPCSILLNYYLDGDNSFTDDIHEYIFDFDSDCDCFEIFSGYDTSTISKYLESTMTEAGIGVPIVHDKYAYCHGRSTLCMNKNNSVIYFNKNTDLDKIMLEELPKYYKSIVKIDVKDGLEGEYKALIEAMYLTKYLADKNKKSLSTVDYNPIVKKLYYFKNSL